MLVALGFLATRLAAQAKPAAKKAVVLQPASEMQWADVAGVKGAKQATLWGNPQKTAHGVIDRLPAGTQVPLHTHTSDLRTVMISGTLVVTLEGQSAKELGSGSYWFLPGGVKHTTSCKAGADCVFFSEGSGPFDLKPADAAGAKAGAKKK
jgi:quercetin dioxygenase-like cupin family protein